MLVIRLQRTGRRNQPQFRLVVTEKSNGPKSGRFNEVLGSYNPKLGERNLKEDRITHWLEQGAQPSGTVHNMLVDAKLIDGKKINVLPQKSPVIDEEAIAAEKEAEAAAKAEEEAKEEPKEETEEEAKGESSDGTPEEKKETPEETKEESEEEKTEEAPTEETKEDGEDKKEE